MYPKTQTAHTRGPASSLEPTTPHSQPIAPRTIHAVSKMVKRSYIEIGGKERTRTSAGYHPAVRYCPTH